MPTKGSRSLGFARPSHDWPAGGHGPSCPGFFLRASASVFHQLSFCIGFSAPVIQFLCGLIAAPRAAGGEARSVAGIPFGRTSWRTRQIASFYPLQIGPTALQHRVVMAPLSRSRSEQPGDIPGNLMVEYYSQCASDGGLIRSEANKSPAEKRSSTRSMPKADACSRNSGTPAASAHVDLRNGATSASSCSRTESKNKALVLEAFDTLFKQARLRGGRALLVPPITSNTAHTSHRGATDASISPRLLRRRYDRNQAPSSQKTIL